MAAIGQQQPVDAQAEFGGKRTSDVCSRAQDEVSAVERRSADIEKDEGFEDGD
jgi:hypothetical protein